jgi:hypothetical protein
MNEIRCLLPNGMAIPLSAESVENVIIPSGEHEAGHAVAAHHYDARVLGIALGFMVKEQQHKTFLVTHYTKTGLSIENRCVIYAAGPAADLIYFGGFKPAEVQGDLLAVKKLTGEATLETYLPAAKEIVAQYSDVVKAIAALLRETLESTNEIRLSPPSCGSTEGVLLNEAQLMSCFNVKSSERPSRGPEESG